MKNSYAGKMMPKIQKTKKLVELSLEALKSNTEAVSASSHFLTRKTFAFVRSEK